MSGENPSSFDEALFERAYQVSSGGDYPLDVAEIPNANLEWVEATRGQDFVSSTAR